MATCKYCGSNEHPSRKRTFECGTTYSGSGTEYRTSSCKLTEGAVARANAAEAERDTANAERDLAIRERDAAVASETEARELAASAQRFVDAEKLKNKVEMLTRLKAVLDELTPEVAA
jgi:hypothetical protein